MSAKVYYIHIIPASHTDECVHCIRCAAHDRADADKRSPDDGNRAAADQIGEGADEWAYTGKGEEVCENLWHGRYQHRCLDLVVGHTTYKPNPPICTSNVTINEWWNPPYKKHKNNLPKYSAIDKKTYRTNKRESGCQSIGRPLL